MKTYYFQFKNRILRFVQIRQDTSGNTHPNYVLTEIELELAVGAAWASTLRSMRFRGWGSREGFA